MPKKVKAPKLIREDNIGRVSFKLIQGDITKVGGGALVNPTNSALSRNSGMSTYLIDQAGSRVFYEMNNWKKENDQLGPCEMAVTCSGNLPSTYIFHTCIPEYNRNDPEPPIRMLVFKVLERTEEIKVNSIIIPCLPKDVYGFSPENCSYGYYSSAIEYINSHPESGITEIKLITLDKAATSIFEAEAARRFGIKEKRSFFSFGKKKKEKRGDNAIEL